MPHPSRRHLLHSLGLATLAAACRRGAPRSDASTTPLAPTVAIPDDDEAPPRVCRPTADNIEGPFFKAGAPSRAVLSDATTRGTGMHLDGRVLDTRCQPIAGATLDLWHADAAGDYDLTGWRLRGRVVTDRHGAWSILSIVPGRYLNGARYRPAHVHVKLAAAGHPPLTTQLYFPGDPYNDGDPWFEPSLLIESDGTRDNPAFWGKVDLVLAER